MSEKYKNWRISIDGDYFSLYIKTWFAFLATLHELYPEKINKKGDGALIIHSAENIEIPLSYDKEIALSIKEMYIAAENLMKRDFQDYYFSAFYKLNNTYYFKENAINGHISFTIKTKKERFPSTSAGTRRRPKNKIYFVIKSKQKQFLRHMKPIEGKNLTYTLNTSINLGKIIQENKFNDKFEIINLAKSQIYEQIEEIFLNREHTEIQKENAKQFFQRIIDSSFMFWSQSFEINNLFQKLPNKDYPNKEDNKKETLKWFIKYSYKLRNVLFHTIIDPFDEDWLPIYKNTYIALKELVDENIKKIEI